MRGRKDEKKCEKNVFSKEKVHNSCSGIHMVTMLPFIASYNRVHLLIPSCGKGVFDLEINMIGVCNENVAKG
jgi:hypothetical protein